MDAAMRARAEVNADAFARQIFDGLDAGLFGNDDGVHVLTAAVRADQHAGTGGSQCDDGGDIAHDGHIRAAADHGFSGGNACAHAQIDGFEFHAGS